MVNKFWKAGWFSLGMFLIHQGKSKGISISLLLGGKMHLNFGFDQLAPTLKRRRKEEGEKKRGDRERASEIFLSYLFLEKTSLVSLLVWHFQWKYSISAGQNARMFYLMEFPTQEWSSSSYCHGCLGS